MDHLAPMAPNAPFTKLNDTFTEKGNRSSSLCLRRKPETYQSFPDIVDRVVVDCFNRSHVYIALDH